MHEMFFTDKELEVLQKLVERAVIERHCADCDLVLKTLLKKFIVEQGF